jgi:hypothetical protein
MGQLMSWIHNNAENVDIFIDFDNAQPGEAEKEIHRRVAEVLDRAPAILDKLFKYTGCEEFIRKAITTPGEETESQAWEAVLPAVDQLQEFYDFSLELENCFPHLLQALCKSDPKQTLENQQALAKQLADVFDFVLRFDDAKMINPAIQNDFSYYRRTLNRMKLTKKDANIKIRDELANRMSLFFAYPTPMMKVLGETTAKFLQNDREVPKDNVTQALAVLANVCYDMVIKERFSSTETNMFCLRSMTGAIILFDHIAEQGAFTKRSAINVKGCIQALKNHAPGGAGSTDGLLNALRFTTVHLNDPETPGAIKQLLA